MRKCSKCLLFKKIEEFPFRNRSKGLRSYVCRDCKNTYLKDLYKSSDSRKNSIKDKNKIVIDKNIQKINEYLLIHPCVDCGETDPIVLEFDHVRGEKMFAISARKYNACKWELIQEEIDKCEVRCANCHRRKTAERKIKNIGS